MTDFHNRLARMGLSEYAQRFVDEGFDTWETLLDIQESDLCVVHFAPLRPNLLISKYSRL